MKAIYKHETYTIHGEHDEGLILQANDEEGKCLKVAYGDLDLIVNPTDRQVEQTRNAADFPPGAEVEAEVEAEE